MSSGARVLYVSYDGMTDPLGRSQVLPYVTGLAARGHEITILSCEKPEPFDAERQAVFSICKDAGLHWHPMVYHRWPPVLSTVYDLERMKRTAAALHQRERFHFLHCRSYIPALVGLAMKRRFGTPFLFDMRGFWADEKVEGGSWPQDRMLFRQVYRYFKRRESELLEEAAAVVSLTDAARGEIERRWPCSGPVTVIPCCVDFQRFELPSAQERRKARADLGIPESATVLCYIGSLGGNYMLAEMLRFFAALKQRRPGAKFLFITRTDPAEITREAASFDDLVIRSANHAEVPILAAAADIGVAFKQPTYSAAACSPTKLGEMLALGIPVVVNAGVGDVQSVVDDSGAGVAVTGFSPAELEAAAQVVLAMTGDARRIRAEALRRLSLADGIDAYDQLYREMA